MVWHFVCGSGIAHLALAMHDNAVQNLSVYEIVYWYCFNRAVEIGE